MRTGFAIALIVLFGACLAFGEQAQAAATVEMVDEQPYFAPVLLDIPGEKVMKHNKHQEEADVDEEEDEEEVSGRDRDESNAMDSDLEEDEENDEESFAEAKEWVTGEKIEEKDPKDTEEDDTPDSKASTSLEEELESAF